MAEYVYQNGDPDPKHIQRVRELAEAGNDAAVIVDCHNKVLGEATYYERKGVQFHASVNAIMKASTNLEGCTMYVRYYPCNDQCAKLIIQSGIKKVFHIEETIKDGTICRELFNNERIKSKLINVKKCHTKTT